ncbi:MAG: two-component system OmpR family sensor kinase [Phenylobacterium sp.]|jgi:two-component system OmpR family sensor kinase
MIRLPALFALIIGMNALMAGLLHGWVYDALDLYVYEQKELLYKQALTDSREVLGKAAPEQWNTLSDELGIKYITNSMIYALDDKDLPSKVLEAISDPIAANGVVDPFTPDIYYPLGEQYVFVLGPMILSTWHLYIIEWATFLAAMLGSSLVLVVYYLMFQKHMIRIGGELNALKMAAVIAVDELPVVDTIKTSKPADVYKLLTQVKHEHEVLEKSNYTHIQSQRDLLHGVAHEFRSPMARMQFALEMIAGSDPTEQTRLIGLLNMGIKELDDLVKELLSYSRIQHLNHQLALESVAVGQMIQESIDKVASFYPEVDFKYENAMDSNIKVDERLIQRALANILRNAGRFSKTLCQVTVRQTPEQLTISIDDDGDGIPPGKRERIFEPFTRLDASRSRDSGGTGLGLAIVQSILEQHDGSVRVDDSDLGGACFCLKIPCVE